MALAGAVASAALAVAAQELSQADADSMSAKLAVIRETGAAERARDAPPVHTSFTERELNAYFAAYGPTFLPDGVIDPRFAIGDRGHVAARGIVDLDAVRKSRQRDWLDPLAYLTGSLEVSAAGFVIASNGMGVFRFESATVAGLSVPKTVLQELVRYYTRTPEMPNGLALDEPFELPANIRTVALEGGRVTIVQ